MVNNTIINIIINIMIIIKHKPFIPINIDLSIRNFLHLSTGGLGQLGTGLAKILR